MRTFCLAVLVVLAAVEARSDIVRSPIDWTVSPDFGKSAEARTALSGAACVTGTRRCLAVNDEKRYAQFFDIGEGRLKPGKLIRLLPDRLGNEEMDEIDAEAATYVPATRVDGLSYLYVAGSHGLPRRHDIPRQPSRFFLFRFPVDPTDGVPTFAHGDRDPSPEIERTDRLEAAMRGMPGLGGYVGLRPDRNGVLIEGMAHLDGTLLFGLRSPSVDGNAFVLRVPPGALFGNGTPPLHPPAALPLGEDVGVRDLAAVDGGVLILAGRSAEDAERSGSAPAPSVWFWSGQDGQDPKNLGNFPGVGPDDKAEGLIVLEESATGYRVLVLFDGRKNGGPTEFRIDR